MANLTLTGQAVAASQIQTRFVQLRTALDSRIAIWQRAPIENQKAWIASGKDPVMTVAWEIYKYLDTNFFGREEIRNG